MSSLDYLDLCRLCLVKDRVSVSIFDGEGEDRQIYLKIAACLPVKLGREDKLPKKICDDCLYKVELLYEFWNTTSNAEKQLWQWLGEVELEDKQGYIGSNINSSEQGENRLNVVQASAEHQNMGLNMIDNMGLTMPIIMSPGQAISVPISSSETVQTVQSMAGPSSQARKDREDDEDSTEDDNTEDEIDHDEGLPVKEENEDTRIIEPTNFVNVASMACDEAGPSGLQQKLPEMTLQATDVDPKSGCTKQTPEDTPDGTGLFFFERESVVMKKWQILEFDGKPYYAFVPENDEPVNLNLIPSDETDQQAPEKSTKLNVKIEQNTESDTESMGNDASFYDYDYNPDNFLDQKDYERTSKSVLMNGLDNKKQSDGDLYQVKVEGNVVTLEKLAENMVSIEEEEDLEAQEEHIEEEVVVEEHIETLEDDFQQEVPQYLDQDSLDSQTMEFSEIEAEAQRDEVEDEGIENVEALEDPVLDAPTNQKPKLRNILPSSKGPGPLKCRACSETFNSSIAFRKHVAWTHKKKVCIQENGAYICAVCDYRTSKKSLFAAHLERKHETWPRKGQNNMMFPCAVCGFVCRSKHSLQSHFIRKHTDKYEHGCTFCDKKFKVKGDLTNHIRFHHKEKPVNCDVCGKLCQNSGSLYVHQKWAHYKPKFECHICKRRMVTQENLDQHMVTQHEKREKIVCAECGKTFSKKDSFKRHMAVHTGSKPHHCPICSKPFARQSQLRQHVLIHTGKRPFVCDICGKAFTQKPGLICHRKTHPGNHPPLPVMPIANLVKEFTEEYLLETSLAHDEEDDDDENDTNTE